MPRKVLQNCYGCNWPSKILSIEFSTLFIKDRKQEKFHKKVLLPGKSSGWNDFWHPLALKNVSRNELGVYQPPPQPTYQQQHNRNPSPTEVAHVPIATELTRAISRDILTRTRQRDLCLWGIHVRSPAQSRITAIGAYESTVIVLRLNSCFYWHDHQRIRC